MRTAVRTIPKLEFIPVPDGLTAPCLAPMPPVDEDGLTRYERLPAYTAEVLGALEECNGRLDSIRALMESNPQ